VPINRHPDGIGTEPDGTPVWTATDQDGLLTSQNCGGWSDNMTAQAVTGEVRNNRVTWTDNGPGTCSGSYRFYCFEL
jgi:hypothetical protein